MIKRIIKLIRDWINPHAPIENKPTAKKKREYPDFSRMSEMDITAWHLKNSAKHYAKHNETIEENSSDGLQRKILSKRKLRFEFVPRKQARKNCRTYLEYKTKDFSSWKTIRDKVDIDNKSVCQICGTDSKSIGFKHSTECHEVWKYNEVSGIQKLTDLEALCVICHRVKHANQYKESDEFDNLIQYYAAINEIEYEQAMQEYEFCDRQNDRIKNVMFKLDMQYLTWFKIKFDDVNDFDCHSKEFNKFIYNKEEIQNEE